jgi:serine/threonine-protein kinase
MIIERISSFRMVRTVTQGEQTTLLHAVSEKSGERVAVRLLRGEAATDEAEQRCQRAVRASQLLAHPAVVRLIQAGRLPDGTVYQIQEQLTGETLAARLSSRARLPANELLRLGRQIATVLSTAHSRGIVHRALRPESLQLLPDPEAIGGERVKITDWGLAQLPAEPGQPPEAPPVPLDQPTYLAPELCRAGTAQSLSPVPPEWQAAADRIDVYSLGVLLFQMATGQPPFAGRAASEVIALHIAALPPKLEQKGVSLPAGLAALVTAMLIKDPTARPTMPEVEARLQQLAAQQQLAKTMLPPPRSASAPAAPPAMVPNANVTVQLRAPAPAPARRTWRWAVAVGLAVVGLYGLWLLIGALLGQPRSTVGEPVREAPGPLSARPAGSTATRRAA